MALIQPSLEVLKNRRSGFEEKMVELSSTVQEQDFHKLGSATPALDGNCSKSSSQSPRDSIVNKQASNAYASERSSTDTASKPSSSSFPTELKTSMKEDQLESTRAEMGEVREENERLRTVLARILKDYQSLQSQISDAVEQQEQAGKDSGGADCRLLDMEEEAELVSLSLGTSSSAQKRGRENEKVSAEGGSRTGKEDDEAMNGGRLTLGLDSSSTAAVHPPARSSPENSSRDVQHKGGGQDGEPWHVGKALKSPRSGDDDVSQQVHVKKARVSVRARCDAPTMSDGCQWRKYGQKISKGNPCPRAYYRCTVAPACPVRKQVQRCAEDMSILITTYEGTHNHPLPMAATAMASTTSAAASMLTSGSSIADRHSAEAPLAISSTAAHHGLSFNVAGDGLLPKQYCLPTSPAINAASPLYPTITLDLTSPAASASPTATQFNRFAAAPGYTSSGFSFSSLDSTAPAASSWSTSGGAVNGGYLRYGSNNLYNNSIAGRSSFYNQQSYLQKTNTAASAAAAASGATAPTTQNNTALTDTIAKAITTDPTFQSALAAAITSIVSGRSQGKEPGSEGPSGQSLWWGSSPSSVPSTSTGSANGSGGTGAAAAAAASYMNRAGGFGASPPQGGSLLFLQPPPLGFPDAKNKSAASPFEREQGA